MKTFAIAIHGGCGVMAKLGLSEEEWAGARADLAAALRAGWRVLREGGAALDAVEAAVATMEESAHFNAGHGAALNEDGIHELDASIMDGRTMAAGAVTLARAIRNPVRAARKVMEADECVILGGADADAFARAQGLETVDQSFFTTPRRVAALESLKRHKARGTFAAATENEKHGTVGAVALDQLGNLAAATSTGGYNNKPAGRIGDSPIPGAGTYARNGVCAVSGTGKGEIFIRHAIAHQVAARMSLLGESVEDAARAVIMEEIAHHGVGAGLVAIDARGAVAAPYNTDGMFRGWADAQGRGAVATHAEPFDVAMT
jgi:beta-aspartyl-peptidase (threonine type)